MTKPRVLVLCTANSCRSQMSEGWLRKDLGDRVEAFSAGTYGLFVHPHAIAVMSEAGVDISHHRSKPVTEFLGQEFDLVVTVCDAARDACPVFPAATLTRHLPIEDPVGNPPSGADGLDDFRRARDEIRDRLVPLVRAALGDKVASASQDAK